MTDLREIARQLVKQWQSLSSRARLGIGAAVGLVLAGLAYASFSTTQVDYAPLYAGLAPEDGSLVVDKLRELKIPYRLGKNGELVEIDRAQVAETRLTLASLGLPRGGAVGYELFDRQAIGVSDFAQKVQFHRALQGELERSIGTLGAVQKARVHLVVPERQLFRTAAEQPSASVVVQLRPGRTLGLDQIQGVVHLVSSSVEGLRPERVTVIDGRGEVLSHRTGPQAGATAALQYQREIEETTSKRALELLEHTVGKGHAAVQVSAQIDHAQVERTAEDFDPERQVVRSEQTIDDATAATGEESAEGVAGARGNLPGGPPPQVTGGAGSRRHSDTKNYEITKVTTKTTQPIGRVTRLTVAVLVDGKYEPVTNAQGAQGAKTNTQGAKTNAKEKRFVERSKEEMAAYAAIVRQAVGFDEKRGDQVEVRCVPFTASADAEGASMSEIPPTSPWLYAGGTAALMLLLGGASYLFLRRKNEAQAILPQGLALPAPVHVVESSLKEPEKVLPAPPAETLGPTPQMLRQQALDLLEKSPERAALMLRAWIHDPEKGSDERTDARATNRS